MRFRYEGLDIDVETDYDRRGRYGVPGVKPYFQACRATVRVRTDEPDHRFARAVELTHKTCPVENLLASGGVDLQVEFVRAEA